MTARKNRKSAMDLALTDAIEQATKLQQTGRKLLVGKKITCGQLTTRLMTPATPKQEQEIREALEQEWKGLEPQWTEIQSRLLTRISKILGKDMKRI